MKMELEVKCTGRGRVVEMLVDGQQITAGQRSSSWSQLTNEFRSPRFLHSNSLEAYQQGKTDCGVEGSATQGIALRR